MQTADLSINWGPLTITSALAAAETALRQAGSRNAGLDADLLLAHVLGVSRTTLRAWPKRMLPPETVRSLVTLLLRRARGEPMAYIRGQREFWSLDLSVNRHCLIPRPETELLVELALKRLPAHRSLSLVDLGTGSGALALAVASERPRCRIVATDVCEPTLQTAQHNGQRLRLDHVEFRLGHWFQPLKGERFHLMLANPPYLADNDPHLRQGDLLAEPRVALVAGKSGLEMLSHIVAGAPDHLEAGGWLLLEHGYRQGRDVAQLLRRRGFTTWQTYRDLAGQERATVGLWP